MRLPLRIKLFSEVLSERKEFEREVTLWRTVIDQALTDLLFVKSRVRGILDWLKTEDYEEVCQNAQLPPEKVRSLFLKRRSDNKKE